LNESDQNKIINAIVKTTPLSKFDTIDEWWVAFKKEMRKELKQKLK